MSAIRCEPQARILGNQAPLPSEFLRRLTRLPVTVFDSLLAWQDRASQRAHLASLDDRLLRDMGLSRAEVDFEVSKPFWRS